MSEDFVKNSIIKYLSRSEWGTNLQFGALHEHGVDIKVRHNRYSRYFLIECKGQGIGRGSSEVSFVYSLGQIISRMKSSGLTRYYYGLGLPEKSAKIAYTLRKSKRTRRMRLAVYCDGTIVVTTPFDLKENIIERFIKEKAQWLSNKISFFKQFKGRAMARYSQSDYLKHKTKAYDLAVKRVNYFNKIYGFKFNKINIKNQKTR